MLRLESLVLAATTMPVNAIRRHIESAIDIVIHLSKLKDKSRRVTRICEVNGINEKGEVNLTDLFVLREEGGKPKLVRTGELHNTLKLEQAGLC
jgi:pilus assembly protein CpaF